MPHRVVTSAPFPIATGMHTKGWAETTESDHFVQFYRTDDYLIDCVATYLADGIWAGEAAVVLATRKHLTKIRERLMLKGVNLSSERRQQQFFACDCEELLRRIAPRGVLDHVLARQQLSALLRQARGADRHVRAFGEAVAVLWAAGHRNTALELEEVWNGLHDEFRFGLYCAYPASLVDSPLDGKLVQAICHCHAHVISLATELPGHVHS